MKSRRRAALLSRALHRIRRVARDALDADPPRSHSHLVCVIGELHDLARRAARRRRKPA